MKNPWKLSLALLSGSQALSQSISVFLMTLSAVAGAFLTTNPQLASLPVASVILGTLGGLFPAAAWMARRGRRSGFRWGSVIGLAGAFLAVVGLAQKNLWVFMAGHLLIGVQQGAFQFLRFAAGEAVPEKQKSQGISLVLAGGIVAAFAGPWLAHFSRSQGLEQAFGMAYLPLLGLYALMIVLLVLLPGLKQSLPPSSSPEPLPPPRPLRTIVLQGPYLQALAGSILGYALMILLMTATPLAMDHHGHTSGETSWIIQWHVLGMFVPSFFTGTLIRRFGHRPILFLGLAALLADALAVLLLTGLTAWWVSLTLLGVGWNFLYIASTSRLTRTYRPEEKEKAQAFHDVVVFTVNVAATYGAAPLVSLWGWSFLHQIMIPVVVVTGVFILGRFRGTE